MRLSGLLDEFWFQHGDPHEAHRWLTQALAAAPAEASVDRARTLAARGVALREVCEFEVATEALQESVTMARSCSAETVLSEALYDLGWTWGLRGDLARARPYIVEGLELCRRLGDLRRVALYLSALAIIDSRDFADFDIAWALTSESLALLREYGDTRNVAELLNIQGYAAHYDGRHELALALLSEGLELSQRVRDRSIVTADRALLGYVAFARCDLNRAVADFSTALDESWDRSLRRHVAWCLEGLAGTAARLDLGAHGAHLLGCAELLRETIAAPLHTVEQPTFDLIVAELQALLGEQAFLVEHARGRAMPVEEMVRGAVEPINARLAAISALEQSGVERLSRRETDVLRLVADGRSNQEIGELLFISPHTAANHVANILNKLGVNSRTEAATWAVRHGLA